MSNHKFTSDLTDPAMAITEDDYLVFCQMAQEILANFFNYHKPVYSERVEFKSRYLTNSKGGFYDCFVSASFHRKGVFTINLNFHFDKIDEKLIFTHCQSDGFSVYLQKKSFLNNYDDIIPKNLINFYFVNNLYSYCRVSKWIHFSNGTYLARCKENKKLHNPKLQSHALRFTFEFSYLIKKDIFALQLAYVHSINNIDDKFGFSYLLKNENDLKKVINYHKIIEFYCDKSSVKEFCPDFDDENFDSAHLSMDTFFNFVTNKNFTAAVTNNQVNLLEMFNL